LLERVQLLRHLPTMRQAVRAFQAEHGSGAGGTSANTTE
jgi:hypothetical protein